MHQPLLKALFEDDRKEYATIWAYIFAYMVDGKFESKRNIFHELGTYKMKLWRVLKYGEEFGFYSRIKNNILHVQHYSHVSDKAEVAKITEMATVVKEVLESKVSESRARTSKTYDDEIKLIIDYFNEKIKQHNPKARGHGYKIKPINNLIIARLKEEFTVSDFYIVIDNMYTEWVVNKPEMTNYFRVETLFTSKFGSYRNTTTETTNENKSVKQIKELKSAIDQHDFSGIAKHPQPQPDISFVTEELLAHNTRFTSEQIKFVTAKKEKWICNYLNEDFKILAKKIIDISINLTFPVPDLSVLESICRYLDANIGTKFVTLKEIDIAFGRYMAGSVKIPEKKFAFTKMSYQFIAEIMTAYNANQFVRETIKAFNDTKLVLEGAYIEKRKKENIDKKINEYKQNGKIENVEKTYDFFVVKHKLIDVNEGYKKEMFAKCIEENKDLDTKKDKDRFAYLLKEKILYKYFDSLTQPAS